MKIKESFYNFFYEYNEETILAYNSLSNGFAEINKKDYSIVKDILKSPNNYSFNTTHKNKLLKDLMYGNFLIEDIVDELEFIKLKNRISRFTNIHFGLTIAPTLNCNFRCTYCFEEHPDKTMSIKEEKAIINFSEKYLETAKYFGITWFGGEPLLASKTIERLSLSFEELCKKYNVTMLPQTIITNGYLLTKKNTDLLKKNNILNVQITLDGDPIIHNKRRKLQNGEGTFDVIIKNLIYSSKLLNISIRINIDKENYNKTDGLYSILRQKGLIDKVSTYMGRVIPATKVCSGIASNCFSIKNYSEYIIDKINDDSISKPSPSYPISHLTGSCCADKLNSFVVTPDGLLFKCWSEVSFDKKESIGSIFDEKRSARQVYNLAKYLNREPFEDENCIKCKYLPICGGGCPYTAIKLNENCTSWKFYLEEMLKAYYKSIK